MTASVSPAPSPRTSESSAKPLLLAAAIFVAVAGGSFVFLRNAGSETSPQPHAQGSGNQPKTPAPTSAAAADENQAPTKLQRERLLENVGSVSSIYLYQTYLNVGMLADAVKNDTYSKDEAAKVLGTITTLLQTADAQMQKLDDIGLEEEEVAAVNQVRKVSALLKSQASHLQEHWKSGSQTSLDQFQQTRSQSWIELRSILGLSAKSE